jgi:hypothetical protein
MKQVKKNIAGNIFKLLILAIIGLLPWSGMAQSSYTLTEYIDNYKNIAMQEMKETGIPASIKLGQGILESGFGNSDLATIANNHFGIKCHGWSGRTFYKDDDHVNECFRAYDDPRQSFRDHSEFLTGRSRYGFLFELDILDYKAWARGLSEAGYATNPRYPQLLIGVIERNQLYEFDQQVVSGGEILAQRNPDTSVTGNGSSSVNSGSDFSSVGFGRHIMENNRIRYVLAKHGDTPQLIARETGIWEWEVYRYNELEKSDILKEGQIVYLQPKRRNTKQNWHVVQEGETMYEISQRYGLKLNVLHRRNSIPFGVEPEPGIRLKLRWSLFKD